MSDDRYTGINGDQIRDGTIQPQELDTVQQDEESSITDDADLTWNNSEDKMDWKYRPFGKNFKEDSSLAHSTTTSTTFQQKLRLITDTLPIGKYRIGWSYSWNYSLASNDFLGRIQVNDTDTVMEHQQEPKDQYSDQIRYCSGFLYYDNESEQSLNIDLDFASNSGGTATIFNARLEIWRVS